VRSGFEPAHRLDLPAGTGEGGPISDVAVLVTRLAGDDAPGDIIDVLEANAALQVSGVGAAELDGAEGLRVDVQATSATLVSFPGGSLTAFPGRKLRVYAVDVDGRTAVVVVDGAAESFEDDVETAEPVLESLDFG
jgi:hypothetical protein